MNKQNKQTTYLQQIDTQQITLISLYKHVMYPDYIYNENTGYMNLSHRSITGHVAIKEYTDIRGLNLSDNEISFIEFYNNCSKLEVIDLSYNPLHYLPAFDKCYKLKEINCSYTSIEFLPTFPSYLPLETINCSKTLIKSLEPILLTGLNIKYINALDCKCLKDISYLFRESKAGFFKKLFSKTDGIKRVKCVLPNLWRLDIYTRFLNEESKNLINGILNGSIRLNRPMRINGTWVGDY